MAALTGWLAAGCTEQAPELDPNALAAIRLTLLDISALGDGPPYPTTSQWVTVTVGVEALHLDGTLKEDYNGTLQASIIPGRVDPATIFVVLQNGVNTGHQLRFRFAFGEARIWMEEVGEAQAAECRNGFDDDGNGLIDFPADPGCFGLEDPSEGTASYVTGISDPLVFQPLDIHTVQYNPDEATGGSPVEGQEAFIERGSLIVNNVTADGFFVTDVDEDRGHDSVFVYNFNYPEGLLPGFKLSWVSGGVAEFQGCTQLTHPSWEIDSSYQLSVEDLVHFSRCEAVDNPDVLEVIPTLVTGANLRSNAFMEVLEGGLIRVENVEVSTTFMDCDFDRSGAISGSQEELCRDVCQRSNLCTEMSSFRKYDQFTCNASGGTVYVTKASQLTDFDVMEGCEQVSDDPPTLSCPQRVFASVTGSLRHVYLTRSIQLWEVTPRFACDLRLTCQVQEDCPEGYQCVEQICNRASVE
ncbi:MAG: hypothetical protein JW797_13185 [Bradymonadales bacterium]|nr:hypothetical protein [Bradymonadales bacterium]